MTMNTQQQPQQQLLISFVTHTVSWLQLSLWVPSLLRAVIIDQSIQLTNLHILEDGNVQIGGQSKQAEVVQNSP
jgi:hypothetical protein